MKKKLLIAGANGHLGTVVVHAALKRGYAVRAADMVLDRLADIKNDALETVKIDVTNRQSLGAAVEGVDAVLSTVGLWKERPPLYTYETVDGNGNINLFDAAAKKGVDKVVYISILNAEKAKVARVMLAKRRVERFLEEGDLNYTVFRPAGLFHDFVEVFRPQILRGRVSAIGDGTIRLQPLSPDDLAECMVDAVINSGADRKIFDIAGPEQYTYREAIAFIAEAMGMRVKISSLPVFAAKILTRVIHAIKPDSFIPPDFIEILTMDSVAEIEPVKKVFSREFRKIHPYLEKHLSSYHEKNKG